MHTLFNWLNGLPSTGHTFMLFEIGVLALAIILIWFDGRLK